MITINKVEEPAEGENGSLSECNSRPSEKDIRLNYPKRFYNLFGSIKDETFINPDDQQFSADQTPRS